MTIPIMIRKERKIKGIEFKSRDHLDTKLILKNFDNRSLLLTPTI